MNTETGTLSPKVSAIRALTEVGYTLIPLRGKIPTLKNWVDTAPGVYGEKELADLNYGVVLRAGDLVVDVDPRNFPAGDRVLARLIALIGPLKSYTVRTGGGGLHIYFRKPADWTVVGGLKEFPGIEFKSAGRQVVGPGSLHPDSGKVYETASGTITEIAEAPASLLALIKQSAVPFSDLGGTGSYKNDAETQGRYLAYLQDVAEPSVEGKNGDHNAFRVACHGRDLGLPPSTTFELLLAHWNERCTPPWEDEELKAKVINAYKFAKGAVGAEHPSAAFEAVGPAPAKDKDPEIAWVTSGPNQKVVKCFSNLLNYLRLPAGGLYKIFAYNDLTGRVEFVSPAPWHRGRMPTYAGVGDNDLKLLKGFLATRHGFEASVMDIEAAITNVAFHERFHPVREYLESLVWDGKPRLNTWLKDYLGAQDGGYPEYLAAVSRKVLCAAVLRAIKPGIEFHHVLVLEGGQDIGKSATCAILGGEYSSDAPIDPHSRDTVDQMQGRWICEMAEMETLRKTDEDALKAFITRKTDRVRLAYGRSTGEYPRQSIFIATKNPRADGTYLKDDTGNRRWWPVRCEPKGHMGQIDFKGLTAARNQLFAEAMHVVKTAPGERLSMDTAILKAQAKAVVAHRHAAHQWTESIAAWLATGDEKPETRREFLTAAEVYREALGGSDVRLTHRDMTAIAGVLRAMGWTQGSKRFGDRVSWGWMRGVVEEKDSLDSLIATL